MQVSKYSAGQTRSKSISSAFGTNGAKDASAAAVQSFWYVDEERVLNPPDGSYYEIRVSEFFNAHHYVTFDGKSGPSHSHSFRLDVRCSTRLLSKENHMVVGYHLLSERIIELIKAYNNTLLNDLPPFRDLQPTSENLLGVIFQQMERMVLDLPVHLTSVTLWEAPTKSITYYR